MEVGQLKCVLCCAEKLHSILIGREGGATVWWLYLDEFMVRRSIIYGETLSAVAQRRGWTTGTSSLCVFVLAAILSSNIDNVCMDM